MTGKAWRAAEYLKTSVPGCLRGHLRAFATQVGVRETRRVLGDHVLTAEELLRRYTRVRKWSTITDPNPASSLLADIASHRPFRASSR